MRLETFFEKFETLAEMPGAVGKLRELVLDLAVTGRLVAQDSCDAPASTILQAANLQRAKLVAARRIKSRPSAHLGAGEQPFELPTGWAWARLSDVGHELGQKVPDERFTYIDVGGIDAKKGRISDRVEKLEPGEAPSRARKIVARGTVIYATVRPYLLNVAVVDGDFDPEPIASTAFGILHPFEGVDNRYLFYWLRSAHFTTFVQAAMKGMAYPAINDEKFYSGPIALPPLAEQQRIVAKVDELMAMCDRLEAQQQERETRHTALARAAITRFADAPTPANLQFLFHPSYNITPADLRKSILTLAVQGKLVPQDPSDEPVDKESECDAAFEIPPNWRWKPLGRLGLCRTGKTPPTGDPTNYGLGFPFIGPGHISLSGGFTASEKAITRQGLENSTEADAGDILMVCIGGSIGKAAICREPIGFNQQINSVRLERELPEYVYLAVTADYFQEQVVANASGSATPIINKGKWERLPIPLPPLAEQRQIVGKVEQLMDLVNYMEEQLAISRARGANVLSALVVDLDSRESPKASYV